MGVRNNVLNRASKGSGMKGQVQGAVLGAVVALVMLFVGIFMIAEVADITAINNTSDFSGVYDSLVDNTSTIYSVLVLALIIVVLAIAIQYLRGFGAGREAGMQ